MSRSCGRTNTTRTTVQSRICFCQDMALRFPSASVFYGWFGIRFGARLCHILVSLGREIKQSLSFCIYIVPKVIFSSSWRSTPKSFFLVGDLYFKQLSCSLILRISTITVFMMHLYIIYTINDMFLYTHGACVYSFLRITTLNSSPQVSR